jgi:hypothetical protein
MCIAGTDIFLTYRWLLTLACCTYATVIAIQWLFRWLEFLGRSKRTALMGRYAMILLLRLPMRRVAWDLAQIAALIAILVYVVLQHQHIGGQA